MSFLTILIVLGVLLVASIVVGSHKVYRWPMAAIIGLILLAELVTYSVVRWIIKAVEWGLLTRMGCRAQLRRLAHVHSYTEWLRLTRQVDRAAGHDRWKARPGSPHYHQLMVQVATERLRAARLEGDVNKLISVLSPCMVKNFGGIMNLELYTETYSGTKYQVEAYVREVALALEWLGTFGEKEGASKGSGGGDRASTHSHSPGHHAGGPPPSPGHGHGAGQNAVREFLQVAKCSFGNTALIMSGGAMLGIYHWGVVKALLERGLLPSIISGTSAGSVVAAYLACRTDKEALDDYENLPRLHASAGPLLGSIPWKLRRLLTKGYLYEDIVWQERLQFFTKGQTFREAFLRTGRLINITCTPYRGHVRGHPPMFLNHITTPNVTLTSAVMASSSVPMLIRAQTLMEKASDGSLRPFVPHVGDEVNGQTIVHLRDGSFECDVPVQAISEMFNAHYTVVSQVNPHIIPFFFYARGQPGQP
eukprot:RCo019859